MALFKAQLDVKHLKELAEKDGFTEKEIAKILADENK